MNGGDSRTRVREFLFRRRLPLGWPMRSDIAYAGVWCLRQPGGDEHVLRGVDVPVVPGAAVRTRPVAGPERQRGEQVPACAARLGAGIPAVDQHEPAPRLLRLVFEHGPELGPTGFADRLGQRSVAD